MYDEEPLEFLPLDDLVEENMADNIDLEEDWGELSDSTERSTIGATSQQKAALRFAFTLGNSSSMPGQSTSMDVPSLDNPRINGSDFRMNSSLLSSSGALMLGSSIDLISSSFASSLSLQGSSLDLLGRGDGETNAEASLVPTEIPPMDNFDYNPLNPKIDDPDSDDDAPGFGEVWRGDENTENAGGSLGKGMDSLDIGVDTRSGFNDKHDAVAEKAAAVEKEDRNVLKSLVNPWLMHDPHDPGTLSIRPFRKGKPFRYPKKTSLLESMDEKTKVSSSNLESLIAGIAITDLNMNLSKPFLPEFSYIYNGEIKRRNASKLKKRREKLLSAAAQRGVLVDESQIKLIDMDEKDGEGEDSELVVSFGRKSEKVGGEVSGMDPNRWNFDTGGDMDEYDFAPDNFGETYRGDGILPKTSSNLFGDLANPIEEPMSYEEHCRLRLEEYFRSAQQQIQETELSARIDEWGAKLAPLLSDQEARPSFDIHVYGTRLIQGFNIPDEETLAQAVEPVCVSLQDLLIADEPEASPPPAYEVSRAFSSMLQLANMGNVKILPKRNAEGLHDITLQLLSTIPGVDIDSIAQQQHNGVTDGFGMDESQPSANGNKKSRQKAKKKA